MADLSAYSLPELFQLQKDIVRVIAERQVSDRRDTLQALKALAAERGFDINELLGAAGSKPVKTAGVALYRNPADASATWTGRGRKPLWVVDHLAKGGTLDQIKI
ncbi:Trans-acting regulatory protein HvrA [Andreprevotia sp. IGB-42]|uniref:H-NS histone family protein n=1 Tax=Andreprevotia sp. IGB-42 TaxID=2497473 RepID=UPI0013586947|nr:H-NS histone family protein [Andreprevotia sp. IGB-42]KAF0815304.1 Trans-acting regulatory protein HvrA [Andreprevotia sp. IGB-42]